MQPTVPPAIDRPSARLALPPPSFESTARRLYTYQFHAGYWDAFDVWRMPQLACLLWFSQPRGGGAGQLFVTGPSFRPVRPPGPAAPIRITGIELAHGVCPYFIGSPLSRLAGGSFPLASLWGKEAIELEEALSNASGTEERWRLLLEAVQMRLPRTAPAPLLHAREAMRRIEGEDDCPTVETLSDRLHLSSRRMHQVLKHFVGCSPNQALRIARLLRVLSVAKERRARWSEIAANQGFFDQSHLIKDAHALLGTSPARFIERHREGLGFLELGWLELPLGLLPSLESEAPLPVAKF